MTSAPAVATVWLLCLAPLAFLPGLEDRWGWPTLLCVVVAAGCAVWVRPTGHLPRGVVTAVCAVLAALIVGALAGAVPLAQLMGRAPRYEGAVALPVYVAAAWAAARVVGPAVRTDVLRHVVRAQSTAAVLLAVVAVLEAVGLRPIDSDLSRPGSLMGTATDQGIMGAISVALLGSILIGAWRRTGHISRWAAVGVIAGAVSAVTSASRGALLAFAVVLVLLGIRWVLTSPHRRRRRDAVVAGVALALVLVAVFAVPLTRTRLLGQSALSVQTIGDRAVMWEDAWRIFLAHPWLGVGPSGYQDIVTAWFGDGWFDRAGVGSVLDSPHSILLQALVVGGVLGTVAALALLAAVVVAGIRGVRAARAARRDLVLGAACALVAAATALLTHLTSPDTLTALAVLTGILVATVPRPAPPAARAAAWAKASTALIAAWVLFLGLSMAGDAALLSARTAAMRGELIASLDAFNRAQALRPWDADIALIAAETLGGVVENGLAGAADPAQAWAARAVAQLPTSSRALFAAGMVASLRGDDAAAEGLLARAAELSPADPRIQHEAGIAALGAGDLELARVHLERALELAPDSQATAAALRDVCARLGDACGR